MTGDPGAGWSVGVEEEFVLVDRAGLPAPCAATVLDRAAARPAPPGAAVHAELMDSQVEAATGVCARLDELAVQVRTGRQRLAEAAEALGARLLAAGMPVHTGGPSAVTRGDRFTTIGDTYAGLLNGYLAGACHVHVGVADADTAVAVTARLRPWLPTLLAITGNSPFDNGVDTGYDSWRMVVQSRFPGSGLPPVCGSAEEYREQVDTLVRCGVLADRAQTFWLARPSPRYPTVEVRVADMPTRVDETLMLAALCRALVRTALADIAAGRPMPVVHDQVGAAAVWSAARHGPRGPAVHPIRARGVAATCLLRELLQHTEPALTEAGDLPLVRAGIGRVLAEGTGAARQREAANTGGTPAVIDMLTAQTRADAGGSGDDRTTSRAARRTVRRRARPAL
jgi:carboxylate-amine ligase